MVSTSSFSFQTSELGEELKKVFHEAYTGHWKIKLARDNDPSKTKAWYLAVVQGRIIFSGGKKFTLESFVETLKYYLVQLRSGKGKEVLEQLQAELSSEVTPKLSRIIFEMEKKKILNYDDIVRSMRLKIISDLDIYLFDHAGQAKFTDEPELLLMTPIGGFDLNSLLFDALKRRTEWLKLKDYIPAADSKLVLNTEAIESSNLTEIQKKQLQGFVKDGRHLNVIAHYMGRDSLEVAKSFSMLIKRGLVKVEKSESEEVKVKSPPEIFIVDDSPLVLQQFSNLVGHWGYSVKHSNNALTAVQTMLACHPSVIFLDINMPGASGFDLIKQIRRQPQLSPIPIVLLTAEKTMSNQWRAQWASCKFLAKPRTPAEISEFQKNLRSLLNELIHDK